MSEQDPDADASTAGPGGTGRVRQQPKRRGKGKRKHTVMKVIGVTALALALVTGLSITYAYRHLNGNLTTDDFDSAIVVPRLEKEEPEGPREPINILVMGTDGRDCPGCNIDGLTGDGARSDTTILLHLSADRKRAYGVSIPRDTLVTRPDCRDADGDLVAGADRAMWNEAFALAGPGCTISQLEQVSGIPVDHHVVINFAGFRGMVDAVGGVRVCIPETIDDRTHGIYLPAGTRDISGKEALSYVRVRNVGNGSDLGRIKRQQAFVASMAAKVVSAGTLANPIRLFNFLDAATKSVTLDEGLGSIKDIADLGIQFKDIGLDKIQFVTIPWQYDPIDPNRVALRQPQANQMWKRLHDDEPLTRRQTSEAISAQNVPSGKTPTASGSPSSSGTPQSPGSPSGPSSPETTKPTGTPSINPSAAAANAEAGLCS